MSLVARLAAVFCLAAGLAFISAGPGSAHEERPATFPDGTGKVPHFRGYHNPRSRVVCRPNSARRIAAMPDGKIKKRNLRMLEKCSFHSIQSAIDSVRKRHTSIYILPGIYREKRWASDKRSIRMDRAGGGVVSNLTIQQSEFNALYILETDGFLVDRVTARGNDEYGVLAFASDHGLIQRSEAYFNGDSGFYPGSGSDLNATNPNFDAVRYAIEIRNNSSHDNTLGYSGTAGNSIWAHDNRFFNNATGIATDSLFPGHPGLPQDHARWSQNEIFSNNSNYYRKYVDTGICAKPMKDRGYIHGTVCPVVPTPVGTGVLIAGGNFNSTDHNWIYDNWRYGTMQFWVPAPLRDEMDPQKLYDTSHHDHTTDNMMGIAKDGSIRHNGMDHWWDDEGEGNCWQGNTYSRGAQTSNFTVPPPSCDAGGSLFTPGAAVKDAGFLSCSQYDRNDPSLKHPQGCTWFDEPTRPTARTSADTPAVTPATAVDEGVLVALPALGLTGMLTAAGLLRRRRAA